MEQGEMSRLSPQLIVFSYHKSGTSLFLRIMTKVCEKLGLSLGNHYGMVDRIDPEKDVLLLPHSLLRAGPERPYRAIRMIRDPRDIWVSGYLYHRRCDEEWCVTTDLTLRDTVSWPQVDYSFAHWPEAWKRGYLERLNNQSYQRNLLDRSLGDGLDFELDAYTACTLAAMREWRSNGVEALDVRLEEVMADFDGSMARIFGHFGFDAEQKRVALEMARLEDPRRMDDAEVARRPQISSRTLSKWRAFLSPARIARFEEHHGDLIHSLGYTLSGADGSCQPPSPLTRTPHLLDKSGADSGAAMDRHQGPLVSFSFSPPAMDAAVAAEIGSRLARLRADTAPMPAVTRTTPDPEIRLLADGAIMRPLVTGPGNHCFVVPAGTRRVWLRSRSGIAPVDPASPPTAAAPLLGVRVTEIIIRSQTREIVIAADDARLTTGWHPAERAGRAPWRWTDGSAALPWTGIAGPAVVTIHGTALAAYPLHEEKDLGQKTEPTQG